jgi:DNA-binding PadR family transcriptional regulator
MARTEISTTVFHILVALAGQDRHGYSVMQDVAARTDGRLKLSPGTLYGAIRRLLELGLIQELDERPDPQHDDERRRYYRLTAAGYIAAAEEAARLERMLRQARANGLVPEDAQ